MPGADLPQLTEPQLRALRRVAFAERGDRPDRDPQVREYLAPLRDLGLIDKLRAENARGWVIGPTPLGVALLRERWLGNYVTRPAVQSGDASSSHVDNPPDGG